MAEEAVKGADGAEEKEPEGLVAKNRELLGELKAVKARLKELSGGLDLEAAKEALEFKERADEEMAKKAGEFEKVRARDKEKAERALAEANAKGAKALKALERRAVDLALSNAIRAAGGDPEYVIEKARPFVTLVEADDDWDVEVKGPDGKPSTLEDVAKYLRTKYPRAFDGTGSSGSGAMPGAGGGGAVTETDPYRLGLLADAELTRRRKAGR